MRVLKLLLLLIVVAAAALAFLFLVPYGPNSEQFVDVAPGTGTLAIGTGSTVPSIATPITPSTDTDKWVP